MSNQTAAVIAAMTNAVNWERSDLDQQAIIEAGNKGLLGKPLTDWLVSKSWVVGVPQALTTEPPKHWREEGHIIYFTLPATDGTTGPQWIKRLERKGFKLSKWAKDVLKSKDFVSTTGVVNNIAVIKDELFSDENRITRKILAEGDRLGMKHGKDISPEIACQIREMFTDEEIEAMGLIWITTMHEPINDSDGDPRLLGTRRYGGGRGLGAGCDDPDDGWFRGHGFAFVVPQVSPQS